MKKPIIAFCATLLMLATARAQRPEWQVHIDWAIQDQGPADCPALYEEAGVADCINHGGRACVMQKAIYLAKKDDIQVAMRLTLITQCHNQEAQHSIAAAGANAVHDYLKQK
jgi:hypothetical protein